MAHTLLEVPRPHPITSEEADFMQRRILIADDNELARQQLQKLLEGDQRLKVDLASNGTEALEAICDHNYSIVITDLKMPHLDGLQLIEEVEKRRIPVTVIVTTGHGSIDEAVQAMRLGAYDFITKPIDMDHVRLVIRRALRERTLQDEVVLLRERLKNNFLFQNMISKSPRMHAVFELINNIVHTT